MGRLPDHGWWLLTAYIVGYDIWAMKNKQPTLTADFRGAICHPIKRLPVILAWGILTVHLFGPEKYDPLKPLEKTLTKIGQRLGW